MDAKPQRLQRAAPAVYGDENIPPAHQAGHQRHKSAANSKNMAATGALNVPPKRTAFGDLSNTSRPVVDVVGKDASKARVKSAIAPANSRDTRFDYKENGRAPAASRASTHGTKYLSAAPIGKATNRGTTLASQTTSSSTTQPVVKPGVFKKTTAVYQDKREYEASSGSELPSSVDALVALVDKQIGEKQNKNPRPYKSQPQLKTDQPILRRTQSKYLSNCERLSEDEDQEDVDDDVTEAAYEDAVEQFSKDLDGAVEDDLVEAAGAVQEPAHRVEFDPDLQVAPYPPSRHSKALPVPPATSEAEEYWDEDEEQDQELYDEQGYTTAHSYRSHGDNTTGGPTTMVAPKATAIEKRELDIAKAYVLQNQTEEEVEEEQWDVSMVAEYGEEIFEYMRELEANMLPNPHYMELQTEIQWSMRSVLMDWLVQVHHRFSLLPETLFLTVNYIDRFLSVKIVSLGKLQLAGATAIFLAAKYEEINCPSVQEIVYMVDSGYTVEEILKAERFMLSMLQFELGWPGPMSFLRRISKADDYDLETRTLAKYFLEVTIMDERFVGLPPSFLAAGAHCLARLFLKKGDWTLAHVHYSGYTMSQLKPLISMIFECCQDPKKHHQAVYEKYAHQRYKRASTYVEGEIAKGFKLTFPSPLSHLTTASTTYDNDSRLSEYERVNQPVSAQS